MVLSTPSGFGLIPYFEVSIPDSVLGVVRSFTWSCCFSLAAGLCVRTRGCCHVCNGPGGVCDGADVRCLMGRVCSDVVVCDFCLMFCAGVHVCRGSDVGGGR